MKKNIIDTKDDFIELINKKKKSSAIVLGLIVLLIISLFFFIPKIQSKIRTSELNYLIEKVPLDKKISFLNEQDIKKEIDEKRAITILFSEPRGEEYNKIIKTFSDSKLMSSFTHSLYIYPIVYNGEEIKKDYGINLNELTVVFFENGKEKNRLIIDSSIDTKTMLVPKLNELPLSSISSESQSNETVNTETPTEVSQSENDG